MAKRKIPCSYCKGEVLATQNGRTTSSQSLFPRMQNLLTAISDLLTAVTGGPKKIPRKEALGGKCKACGGKGEFEDPTDTSEQDKAASDFLKSKAEEIKKHELALGNSPGGSMLERIAGAKVTIVGRTLNTAKSVTVHKGKAKHPTKNVVKKAGPTTESTEDGKGTNVVTGNNPPANTGGGIYYIQCGNKFKLTAGAQGVEIGSYGPISIDGSQVRITGAEVSIGGNSGPTLIEGDHLQINGKSIALTPSGQAGEVVIQGAASCTGNLKAGGAYVENMYCASLTMPEAQVASKVSSSTDFVTGPAKWGGVTSPTGGKLATQNLVKWVQDGAGDVNLASTLLSPRGFLKVGNNVTNVTYNLLPYEPSPTGYILPGTLISLSNTTCPCNYPSPGSQTAPGLVTGTVLAPILLNNFPHTHAEPDTPHSHTVPAPAIDFQGNADAQVVRSKFTDGNRVPSPQSQSGNYITKVAAGVGGVVSAAGALFSNEDPYTA